MTRLVSLPSSPQRSAPQAASALKKEQRRDALHDPADLDDHVERSLSLDDEITRTDELLSDGSQGSREDAGSDKRDGEEKSCTDNAMDRDALKIQLYEMSDSDDSGGRADRLWQIGTEESSNVERIGCSRRNVERIGCSRRLSTQPLLSPVESLPDSEPSFPSSDAECDGYNSADEHNSFYVPSHDDEVKERCFELEIKQKKGLKIKRMVADGNCLFRAVADQVYGDPEAYDTARQLCIDYMEKERDNFSQFITEDFASYCKRKRRDKEYGNYPEIQALSNMYNRPIHIYSYGRVAEPMKIFREDDNADKTPIMISYHHGRHYNSLVYTCLSTKGAGLGSSSPQRILRDELRVVKYIHKIDYN